MFSLLILHHLTVALCKADLSFLFTTIDIVLSSKKQREWLILLIDSVPLNYSPVQSTLSCSGSGEITRCLSHNTKNKRQANACRLSV